MTACMSIFHLAGQCSLLISAGGGNSLIQGIVRVGVHLMVIGAALLLRQDRLHRKQGGTGREGDRADR